MEENRSLPRYIMGFTIVIASFAILCALMIFEIPRTNRDIIVASLALVLGWGATVVNYEFGSSRKSGTQPVTVENKSSDPIPVEAK
jgi:hypothetical protein